ncbi:unnamed protein product [Eruca vesicaria subsp. sativa]|uniref:RING-type E3 ubiquitin transferase n=1 Tax=Eruca vesicaria subsp. sativa TaxID=29727 RepID=A0ABC8LG57_ERUVS|nr:unnamed protein product [Eruca vesicaria subsp. sativa]
MSKSNHISTLIYYALSFESETHHATSEATRALTINIKRCHTNEKIISIPLEFSTTAVGSLTDSTFTIMQYMFTCHDISTYSSLTIDEKTSSYVYKTISSLARYEDIILHLTDFNPPSVYRMDVHRATSILQSARTLQSTKDKYEQCTICMDIIVEGQIMNALQCTHIYHHQCITDWIKINVSCHVCKETIS